MKDIHSIVLISSDTQHLNALDLMRINLLAMGAKEPLKMWGDKFCAQSVYTAKQQYIDQVDSNNDHAS